LAGESAADEIDGLELARADVPHVLEPFGVGEPGGEDFEAEGVLLDLPERPHSCPLEAEVEPSDAGEQGANRQNSSHPHALHWWPLLDKSWT
jgi:hypothetical protein